MAQNGGQKRNMRQVDQQGLQGAQERQNERDTERTGHKHRHVTQNTAPQAGRRDPQMALKCRSTACSSKIAVMPNPSNPNKPICAPRAAMLFT
ncbi:hypothetical protein ANFP_17050 [Acidithiobacillus ferrooxidans]|nr:hypothetical protein ANFP_17050 [Acidithiobacillus ferrooxidans]